MASRIVSSTAALTIASCFFRVLSAQPPARGGRSAQAATTEADLAARRLWDAVLTKCGDSYLLRDGDSTEEYRQVSFRTVSIKLSDADRLNGKDWLGAAVLSAHVWRKTDFDGNGTARGWGEWNNGGGLRSHFRIAPSASYREHDAEIAGVAVHHCTILRHGGPTRSAFYRPFCQIVGTSYFTKRSFRASAIRSCNAAFLPFRA